MNNSVPGFLQENLPQAVCPQNLDKKNWFGSLDYKVKLIASNGGDRFNIFYYGDLYDHSIVDTASAPALIVARDVIDNEEILLFDGAIHGYEALFGSTWDEQELQSRKADKMYYDKFDQSTFQVIVWANYGIDYEEEKNVYTIEDDPTKVELINQEIIPFDLVKKIGFDAFGIITINDSEGVSLAVEMELA